MKRLKAAMCAVLAGLMLAGCAVQPQTDNKRGGGVAVDLTKYVVKEAAYPAYPKEPRLGRLRRGIHRVPGGAAKAGQAGCGAGRRCGVGLC